MRSIITQNSLSIYPSSKGYSNPDTAPLVFTAQLSLDFSNLVRDTNIDTNNPIVKDILDRLNPAMDSSKEIGGYLDYKEQNFLRSATEYISAIVKGTNSSEIYQKFLNDLDLMTPISSN
jgi:archaellum biogenesis protein FlaJ (TadC family)